MEIKAYKSLFFLDPETKISRPSREKIELLSVSENESKAWIMHTYDSGEEFRKHGFYQIAIFVDPFPYTMEDIEVVVGIGDGNEFRLKENYLDYDPSLNLWYQQHKSWRKARNNTEEYLPVVTTAGVFKIFVRHKQLKRVLDTSPWIYVLPKDISLIQYIHMLSDLIFLNDQLIKSDSSVIGAGSLLDEGKYILEWAKEFRQKISILQEPQNTAVQLSKRYVKTDIHKIHRFDARVLKSYIQNGLTGKIDGIEYYESIDVYENRVVKSALKWLNVYFDEVFLAHNRLESAPEMISYKASGAEKRKLDQIWTDQNRLYEDRKKRYEENKRNIDEAKEIITSILSDGWFDQIALLEDFHFPIRETPKFLYDTNYSDVYGLLCDLEKRHYLLSGNIDINAFGVTHTQEIYEYWVFYKILYRLYELGFSVTEQERMQISTHFRKYVEGERNAKGYSLTLEKKNLEKGCKIEVGYNCQIGKLTPDYYIRFIDGNENRWYFMDAKYKPYSSISEEEEKGYSIYTEIRDVAVKKYIRRMAEEELKCDSRYKELKNTVCGSYLIVAILKDEASRLDIGDRLFGGGELDSSNLINNEHNMAAHRYGAIQLLPGNDEELMLLMELIFEYKENKWKNVCWRCGSTDVEVEHQSQHYSAAEWVTCRKCFAFRADNHCNACYRPIIKHSNGNYHKAVENQKWMFVCPNCGSGGSSGKVKTAEKAQRYMGNHTSQDKKDNLKEEREVWFPIWYEAILDDPSASTNLGNGVLTHIPSKIVDRKENGASVGFDEDFDMRHGLSKPGYNSYGSYWRKRDHRDNNEI